MFRSLLICALAVLASTQLRAQDAPPSQAQPASKESIEELLELGNMHNLLDKMSAQITTAMHSAITDAFRDKALTPQQKEMVEELEKREEKLLQEFMGWDSLEPMLVDIYQKSLSEDEIQGMIAFYRTPAGQALIVKMPVIMNNTMSAVLERQKHFMSQIQQMVQETVADIKAKSAVSGS